MMQREITTANPYIEQLRQSLQQTRPVAVDWLVLAHNDQQLLARLDEAFPDSALAVIALPQHHWQVEDESMTEVVEWAIRELGVKGVLLVGHSQSEEAEESIKLLGGKVKALTSNGTGSFSNANPLLERIRKVQARATRLQQQLAIQLDKLSRMTLIQSRLLRRQLQLHGLFYRAESGVFYVYDEQRRDFRPLLHEAAA